MSNPQRELLFARSNGMCQCIGACALHAGHCPTGITLETFHRSHMRSRAHGGLDHETNLEAWCSRCNLTLQSRDARDPRVLPREWQMRELDNIVGAIARTGAATLSAAPGAGKTIFASLVFEALQDAGIAARLMVVVPRRGLAEQWMDALAAGRKAIRNNGRVTLSNLTVIRGRSQNGGTCLRAQPENGRRDKIREFSAVFPNS